VGSRGDVASCLSCLLRLGANNLDLDLWQASVVRGGLAGETWDEAA
jgi:hypothetical protein